MSTDIIVLRFPRSLDSLEDVGSDDAQGLGEATSVRSAVEAVFQSMKWDTLNYGLAIVDEAFALEVSLPEDKGDVVTSLHIGLKTGLTWDTKGRDAFFRKLDILCIQNGWQAFSVSDNSRIQYAD